MPALLTRDLGRAEIALHLGREALREGLQRHIAHHPPNPHPLGLKTRERGTERLNVRSYDCVAPKPKAPGGGESHALCGASHDGRSHPLLHSADRDRVGGDDSDFRASGSSVVPHREIRQPALRVEGGDDPVGLPGVHGEVGALRLIARPAAIDEAE